MKRLVVKLIFKKDERALIYDTLSTMEKRNDFTLNETLKEDAKVLSKIKKAFKTNIDYYK